MSSAPRLIRETARQLTTTVALVTSNGKHGPNVMSAEWSFNVSYNPMRVIVLIHESDATHENIGETKEFGVNFASDEQAILANLAGAYTGKEVNKLSSDLFETYPAKKINVPMIIGCFMNAECRLVKTMETGDHTMFLADVIDIQYHPAKNPLLYSQRKYWHRGSVIEKPPLLYVTSTVKSDQVRIDGRLQGVDDHPQRISLKLFRHGQEVWAETADTDEQGYFEAIRKPKATPSKGKYSAEARWNSLTGRASTEY